ncbi:hypothetical protein FA09DRAFT_56825 [Tilletiopsis washingtonensis]|uniref:Uncharacterized protein n=1 Tax=Tilletiopsis washingtonensis TaxID=58919 RepID=A0A316Z975_9BASI|nr:hypothetical protein FA09DRAFT_56825 [Tilletiopsis washingtonensis]PWN97502.1 hypothetical protein FA09DRAFT_56825 [Tilletiopsis washingtonensis]
MRSASSSAGPQPFLVQLWSQGALQMRPRAEPGGREYIATRLHRQLRGRAALPQKAASALAVLPPLLPHTSSLVSTSLTCLSALHCRFQLLASSHTSKLSFAMDTAMPSAPDTPAAPAAAAAPSAPAAAAGAMAGMAVSVTSSDDQVGYAASDDEMSSNSSDVFDERRIEADLANDLWRAI